MRYNGIIALLELFVKALIDPRSIANDRRKSDSLDYSNDLELNNSMNNNIYAESENSNIEYNQSVPREDSKSYNDNKNNSYYNNNQNTSPNPQGSIDSITQEITGDLNNNIYAEPENSNIEYNQSVPREDSKYYNDNKNNGYYNNNDKQDTSSNPQGVIDSIAQELTTVRLKQAIILSEIIGKPRSKTRKKRRF